MPTSATAPTPPATPTPQSITPTTTPGLPSRPRLLSGLPVLRRMAGETQIGTDPRHAVVVTGIPEPLAAVLHGLDGRHTTDELMARAGPDHRILHQILTGLAGLGLIDDAAPADPVTGPAALASPARLSADRTAWVLRSGHRHTSITRCREPAVVVVHGSGRIAVALATLLAASGVGWVHTVAAGVVQPSDTGSGYLDEDIGHARAEAAERAVRRIAPETRTGRPDPRKRPDLVILTDAAVPEPRLSAGLSAAGLPHLVVHAGEGTGTVGPLVVPMRTSCLHCIDLHNTDVDPCWPALAAQLADRPQPADLATAQATAAFAAGQALRFLHSCQQAEVMAAAELPVWSASVEIDVFGCRSTRVERLPHPQCPCGVAGSTAVTATADPAGPIPSSGGRFDN